MNPRDVLILAAQRTPIGAFQGALSGLSAPKLGSLAMRAVLERAGVRPELVDEVYVGTVLPAGIGQAPARQAALGAGLPNDTPATTINKMCGSGLKAVMLGATQIRAQEADIVLCGGMESMSRVPYYVEGARSGLRLGDGKLVDGILKDGLWDVYNDFHMGNAAELCAREMSISRAAQDEFAAESYARALRAERSGAFATEIVPVEVKAKNGDVILVETDEEPARAKPERFAMLRPSFEAEGTVTAANASSLSDGAAMVLLAARETVDKLGFRSLATVTGQGSAAQAPEWFTTAPAKAVRQTLHRMGLGVGDVDLFEINEAFSVVGIANALLLELDRRRLNVRGGAVALGHPVGATGARILTTLLHALEAEEKRRGVASICIGGGEAVSLVVERERTEENT